MCARVCTHRTHSPHALTTRTHRTHSPHALTARTHCTHPPHALTARTHRTHTPRALTARTHCTHSPHPLTTRTHSTHSQHIPGWILDIKVTKCQKFSPLFYRKIKFPAIGIEFKSPSSDLSVVLRIVYCCKNEYNSRSVIYRLNYA